MIIGFLNGLVHNNSLWCLFAGSYGTGIIKGLELHIPYGTGKALGFRSIALVFGPYGGFLHHVQIGSGAFPG